MKKNVREYYKDKILNFELLKTTDLVDELVCSEKVKEINIELFDTYYKLKKGINILENNFLEYQKFNKDVDVRIKISSCTISLKFNVLKKDMDDLKIKNENISEKIDEQAEPERISTFLNKAALLLKLYELIYNIFDTKEEIGHFLPIIEIINNYANGSKTKQRLFRQQISRYTKIYDSKDIFRILEKEHIEKAAFEFHHIDLNHINQVIKVNEMKGSDNNINLDKFYFIDFNNEFYFIASNDEFYFIDFNNEFYFIASNDEFCFINSNDEFCFIDFNRINEVSKVIRITDSEDKKNNDKRKGR